MAMRVLVVDDEPPIRHLVDRLLTRRGHDVLTAPSVFEAMALLLDFPAPLDLALLDVRLPGMAGLAYADQLERAHPAIRLVFMTGSVDEAELVAAETRGSLILKPFGVRDLIAAVEVPTS